MIHATPSRRPTTTRGTTITEPGASSAKVKLVNATGPVPGSPTSSATDSRPANERHHRSASRNRAGPAVASRATSPQPTRPSPPWTQASAPFAVGEQVEQAHRVVDEPGSYAQPGR